MSNTAQVSLYTQCELSERRLHATFTTSLRTEQRLYDICPRSTLFTLLVYIDASSTLSIPFPPKPHDSLRYTVSRILTNIFSDHFKTRDPTVKLYTFENLEPTLQTSE